jgi:hypothetical protein
MPEADLCAVSTNNNLVELGSCCRSRASAAASDQRVASLNLEQNVVYTTCSLSRFPVLTPERGATGTSALAHNVSRLRSSRHSRR